MTPTPADLIADAIKASNAVDAIRQAGKKEGKWGQPRAFAFQRAKREAVRARAALPPLRLV